MSIHRMRRHDTRPFFRVTLKNAGVPVDLSGAAVAFHMDDDSGLTLVNTPAVIIQSSPTVDVGVVEWQPVAPETDRSGSFIAEWEVTFPDNTVETYPTTGLDRVLIRDDQA